MEDIEIVRRVKGGDVEAFSVLVEKYHRHLLNFIFRLVGDEDIVEDIGQEVFLSVYKSLGSFDEKRGTPFSVWLFISARNRCISELRNRKGQNVSLDDALGVRTGARTQEEVLIENERRQAIRASLAQLSEPYRSTIMRGLRGDSLDEIASSDGVPLGTVKSRLSRAKEKMKLLVRAYYGGKGYERV